MPPTLRPESRSWGFSRMVLFASCVLATATEARGQLNLDFERAQPQTGLPAGWRVTESGTRVELDAAIVASGERSLHLTRVDEGGSSRIAQEIDVDSVNGDRVRMSAHIRLGDETATPPALWIRVEEDARLLYVDSIAVAASLGSWTRYELEAPIAKAAKRLSFGVELRGPSDAWVDDFRLEFLQASSLPEPSAIAGRYIERALAIVETNSVYRNRIEWPDFRRAVFEQARGADTIAESHLAVRFAMSHLNDGHSYFMAPRQMQAIASRPVANARTGRDSIAPRGTVLDGKVGYLMLPGFAGGTHADQAHFAGELQSLIAELDEAGVCGFIVDLRDNSGGNLWPMLAGVGPLLGDGEIAAAVDPESQRTSLWYRQGKVGLGDNVQLRVRGTAYVLRNSLAPVAIVTDGSTASAAEVIAAGFATRQATRRFGFPTRGAVTGTRVFPLSDGAALVLAVTQTSGLDGRLYTGPIEPDEPVDASGRGIHLSSQPVIRAALGWLASAPACATGSEARR